MARELRAHTAPEYLVRASERAAHEEVGHVRMVGTLARRYGEAPRQAVLAPNPPTRGLEEIALENAVEGCARETFGAVLAQWQARHATDPAVRRAMAVIGVEEAGHADLAWQVADWAERRLPRGSRRRVVEARERELAQLRLSDPLMPSASLAALGLPDSETVGHLAAALANGLM
jgi:predicted metal-dependent hydrolase